MQIAFAVAQAGRRRPSRRDTVRTCQTESARDRAAAVIETLWARFREAGKAVWKPVLHSLLALPLTVTTLAAAEVCSSEPFSIPASALGAAAAVIS